MRVGFAPTWSRVASGCLAVRPPQPNWHAPKDSNPDRGGWSSACCRYTRDAGMAPVRGFEPRATALTARLPCRQGPTGMTTGAEPPDSTMSSPASTGRAQQLHQLGEFGCGGRCRTCPSRLMRPDRPRAAPHRSDIWSGQEESDLSSADWLPAALPLSYDRELWWTTRESDPPDAILQGLPPPQRPWP